MFTCSSAIGDVQKTRQVLLNKSTALLKSVARVEISVPLFGCEIFFANIKLPNYLVVASTIIIFSMPIIKPIEVFFLSLFFVTRSLMT